MAAEFIMLDAHASKSHHCAADTEMEAEVEPSIETQARLAAAEQEERFRQVPADARVCLVPETCLLEDAPRSQTYNVSSCVLDIVTHASLLP